MFVIINKNSNQIVGTTTDGTFNAGENAVLVETELDSVSGYTFDGNSFVEDMPRIKIKVTSIPNAELDYDDTDNEHTLLKQVDYVALANIDTNGQTFRTPFKEVHTGAVLFMRTVVDSGGKAEIFLNFPVGGEWVTNSELINKKIPLGMPNFSIEEQTIIVM